MSNKTEIASSGFKIRWISCACFEIEMPSGKKILTDPYITDSPFSTISLDDLSGADYVLLSHTHFDHVTDLGEVAKKFNSKVLVGSQSAYDITSYFELNPKHIYPVSNGDVFEFDDCKIEVFFGKHIDLPFTLSQLGQNIAADHGYKGMERVNSYGSLEFVNYLITLKNNVRIFIWGGKVADEQYNRFRDIKPNVALMQVPGNSIKSLSEFIGHINPQIVIPHHHDSLRLPGPLGIVDVDEYLVDLVESMKVEASNSALLDPVCGQWYEFTMGMKSI